MQRFINKLKLSNITLSIILLKDNELSVKLMYNVKQHSYIKHIDVQHHYIQNVIDNKELIVE